MGHPAIVGSLAECFSHVIGRSGLRPEVSAELYLLSKELGACRMEGGRSQIGLVTGPMHEGLLRHASGQPSKRFLVASDRFGNAAFPNAIIPAEVFAAAGDTTPIVIYGQTSGAVTGEEAAGAAHEAIERGVRILRVPEGFHAKFLAWGEDNVVVTSLNWGSATPSVDFAEHEIGVHVHASGIARFLNERLKLKWENL